MGRTGFPSNKMWPGPRQLPPHQMASWSIQPFRHNTPTSQTDRTDRTIRQRSDSIRRTALQTVAQLQANIGEVVEKPLYKCISEGLMNLAVWYHHPTKVHEIRGLTFNWSDPENCKFHRAPTKKCARYPLWKNFAHRKGKPKFTLCLQIYHQSTGRTRVSIDTVK